MTTIQARRQLIVILLLCVAAVAAVIRHHAEPGSTVRNVSTVMMLLWLPVIGSIVGWCYGRLLRKPAPPAGPAGFAPAQAFHPHALAEITLRRSSVPAENIPKQAGEHRCVLVVGSQGFQMRWQLAAGDMLRQGETREVPVQFLAPQMALPACPQGTVFRMLIGETFVGDGRLVRVLT